MTRSTGTRCSLTACSSLRRDEFVGTMPCLTSPFTQLGLAHGGPCWGWQAGRTCDGSGGVPGRTARGGTVCCRSVRSPGGRAGGRRGGCRRRRRRPHTTSSRSHRPMAAPVGSEPARGRRRRSSRASSPRRRWELMRAVVSAVPTTPRTGQPVLNYRRTPSALLAGPVARRRRRTAGGTGRPWCRPGRACSCLP